MEEQQQAAPAAPAAPAPVEVKADPKDAEQNKLWAILGYIIPMLFFIPLVSESSKNSPFAKFHANQQLNLLIFVVVGYIASSVLMFVLIGFLLYPIVMIASLVFLVMGVMSGANGTMKPLPVIGGFKLIK